MFLRSLIVFFLFLPLHADRHWIPCGLPEGWSVQGNPRIFRGNDLYGYINGGSELFLEFGFDTLTVHRITGPGGSLTVDVYRMHDGLAALGIYLAKCSPETPLEDVAGQNSGDRYQLAVLKGRHFVFINNTSGDAALLPVMKEIAAVLPEVWATGKAVLPELPPGDVIPGSIRLARGPYGMQPVYTLGEGDVLRLAEGAIAVIADCREVDPAITRILVHYTDEASAHSAFENLKENLDPYLSVLFSDGNGFRFKDYAQEYGMVQLTGSQIRVDLHLKEMPQRRMD